jgi:hypothetical protein
LINRLSSEHCRKAMSRKIDFNAIKLDGHAAEQTHEPRFNYGRYLGSESFRHLTAAFDQFGSP